MKRNATQFKMDVPEFATSTYGLSFMQMNIMWQLKVIFLKLWLLVVDTIYNY
jgi:hypothetical protein